MVATDDMDVDRPGSEPPPRPARRRSAWNALRYRFDNLFARGTWVVLVWLAAVTVAALLVSSAVLAAFRVSFGGSEDSSWLEDFWQSLLRVIDPGTMAADVGWAQRTLALTVTLFGVLVAGTLIGLIANGVEQYVDRLRRGRSTVVESGHVVILGHSDRLPVIVEQVALANRTQRANKVVVLSLLEPDALADEVRAVAGDLHGTRLVVRRGDPTRIADLRMVAVNDARTVIALAHSDDGDTSRGDARVVNAVLAVGAALGGFDRIPIIAEIAGPTTAASLAEATGPAVRPVTAQHQIAQVAAFALREPGISWVLSELLDLNGADIHLHGVGDLAGSTFGDAVFRFPDARPIGRMTPSAEVHLAPPVDVVLQAGDRLILLADDERPPARRAQTRPTPTTPSGPGPVPTPRAPERLLVIGWSAIGVGFLAELDRFVAPGSTVEIVYDKALFGGEPLQIPPLEHLEATLTPSRAHGVHEGLEQAPTAIILLGYRRDLSIDETDSRTLLNLLSVRRDMAERRSLRPRVVVELRESGHVDLARMLGADDYVVSDALASRIMVQLAEQPERSDVFARLYDVGGPNLRLPTAGELGLDRPVEFADIVEVCLQSGRLALGWRRADVADGGLTLNPPLSARVQLDSSDQIIVIQPEQAAPTS